jgi:hypothetical protein
MCGRFEQSETRRYYATALSAFTPASGWSELAVLLCVFIALLLTRGRRNVVLPSIILLGEEHLVGLINSYLCSDSQRRFII